MNKRTVVTENVHVKSVTISSELLIGDLDRLTPTSRAIAVQREAPEVIEENADFDDYPIFKRELSPPLSPLSLPTTFHHNNNEICVGSFHCLGASTASAIQIGGTNYVDALSRVKHIRILNDEQ
ncbi:spore germination protein GerPE [Halobacillus shinanisalinarum]|uniref:Spore germination protein GerPE n=1 Tax=Halobacillus shinanisalinarum TaxID=2932258 RepID=A0ABY4GYP6_9BACI|nr:spore germination protein GerPE [Halobacillus shinanisalinarum]UOQ92795.1 spore germination protein GerPE [Halobacillus shinanisalinarum]